MAVFDRSWYGRVLVERIEGFATIEQWSRAYDEIVEFERTLVLEGLMLVKLWLHISDEEQLRAVPLPRGRSAPAVEADRGGLAQPGEEPGVRPGDDRDVPRTDHDLGPWDLIPAENKRFARVAVLETVIARVEEGMSRHGMPVPGVEELARLVTATED